MHLSSDVAASGSENFHHSSSSEGISAKVKRELPMEIDDKNTVSADNLSRKYDTSGTPNEGHKVSLDGQGPNEIPPLIRIETSSDIPTCSDQTPEKLNPDSWHKSSTGSLLKEPWQSGTKKGFGNLAWLGTENDSDKTGCEPHPVVFGSEASRSHRKEAHENNIDGRLGQSDVLGSQTTNSGQANGITTVPHQARSCQKPTDPQLVLSTPFGLFHRTPLSFCWAGEQSASGTSTPHSDYTPGASTSVCQSLGDRDVPRFLQQKVDADGRNEIETSAKVMFRFLPHDDYASALQLGHKVMLQSVRLSVRLSVSPLF